ncbi:hypothetical protein ACNQGL_02365 [Flavobacterium sp. LB3P21]|uniref:hypothetical protein n=1 Tax=Flavobacterium sp. LB3P21 TaxID=3401719 RepID=UPI003AAEDA17
MIAADYTNFAIASIPLGVTAPQFYKWRKGFEEFGEGSFLGKRNLKLTPEQEKIRELR